MADNPTFPIRTFCIGALCGAAVACAVDRLLLRQGGRRRLVVLGGRSRGANVVRIPLKRDDSGGDPAGLTSHRGLTRAGFERRGGAPGGGTAAESVEVPGHPGERLDHSDPAQRVRSATRTQDLPPAADTQV